MNSELELKIQACLDNELSAAEARKVMELVRQDPEAADLFETLSTTRQIICGNEPERPVPASREFYWSQIERQIAHAGTSPRWFSFGSWNWPMRFALAGAAAALVALAALPGLHLGKPAHHDYAFQEIESPSEDVNAITFHSVSANMTVVWVQTQEFDTN